MSKRLGELGWFAESGGGWGDDLSVEHILCGDGARGMRRGCKSTVVAGFDDGVGLSL
jgi:hypothetical protein